MIHLGWSKWFNLKLSEKCCLLIVWPWAYYTLYTCREHISVTLCLVVLKHKAPTKQSQHFSASYHSVHHIIPCITFCTHLATLMGCAATHWVLLAQITVNIHKHILIPWDRTHLFCILSQLDLSDLTGSARITDFQCSTYPEVRTVADNPKD